MVRDPRFLAGVAALAVLFVGLSFREGGFLARDTVWARIQERGVWRVGMDPSFPPFESLDDAGRPVGLDVDLVHEIARRMGVRAEITGVGFDELVDAAAARRIDAAVSALPSMPWRTKEVAFSHPYIEAGLVLAARPEQPVSGVAGLPGRRVAAEWGSQGDALARELAAGEGRAFELVLRESADGALQAVLDGQADAAIVDAITLGLFDRGAGRLVAVGPPLQSDPYVVVLPTGAPELLERVNAALDAMAADGVLDALRARWLSQ